MQIEGMYTLKIFRKQQRVLDAMLQCVKVFRINIVYIFATWHVQMCCPKAFSGIHAFYQVHFLTK